MSITCRSVHTYPKTDDNNKGELKTIVKSQILLDLLSYKNVTLPFFCISRLIKLRLLYLIALRTPTEDDFVQIRCSKLKDSKKDWCMNIR